MKVSIIIPAHNEEGRIKRTLFAYLEYFSELREEDVLDFELVVVLNGCTDNTLAIVQGIQKQLGDIVIVNIPQAGKGIAIKIGFEDALTRDANLIGFVDADMATAPEYFYDLIEQMDPYDGVIASRYMSGAVIAPSRPLYKRWGSKLVYEPLIWLLFGISYYDFQCGAKLFSRKVIHQIAPLLHVKDWTIDLEILYLCKKYHFKIKEVPTVWHDQAGSKLTSPIRSGLRMIKQLFKLRFQKS